MESSYNIIVKNILLLQILKTTEMESSYNLNDRIKLQFAILKTTEMESSYNINNSCYPKCFNSKNN